MYFCLSLFYLDYLLNEIDFCQMCRYLVASCAGRFANMCCVLCSYLVVITCVSLYANFFSLFLGRTNI